MELTCLTRETVYVNGHKLNIEPSLKYSVHSPTGFMWGYGGSGPAQLALAVMLVMTGKKPDEFDRHYQEFKRDVIARLPQKPCALEMDFFAWYYGETNYRFEVHELDDIIDTDDRARCSFPLKCQSAKHAFCDCACGGVNHGVIKPLFAQH